MNKMGTFTVSPKKYQETVQQHMPNSKILQQCFGAFIVGGIICVIGQAVHDILAICCSLEKETLAAATSIVMVFLGATLTGIGIYDKIASFAGAGSIVPITGFANSIVSPAMEFKREGYVMGVGAKLFSIAGPVLVYGISSSILAGLISLLFH